MHWALAAAEALENPDADRVLIEVRTRQLGTTTRSLRPGEESPDEAVRRLTNALDVVFTVLTGPPSMFRKQTLIDFVRGSLHPETPKTP
jgi:hypothetical protein